MNETKSSSFALASSKWLSQWLLLWPAREPGAVIGFAGVSDMRICTCRANDVNRQRNSRRYSEEEWERAYVCCWIEFCSDANGIAISHALKEMFLIKLFSGSQVLFRLHLQHLAAQSILVIMYRFRQKAATTKTICDIDAVRFILVVAAENLEWIYTLETIRFRIKGHRKKNIYSQMSKFNTMCNANIYLFVRNQKSKNRSRKKSVRVVANPPYMLWQWFTLAKVDLFCHCAKRTALRCETAATQPPSTSSTYP